MLYYYYPATTKSSYERHTVTDGTNLLIIPGVKGLKRRIDSNNAGAKPQRFIDRGQGNIRGPVIMHRGTAYGPMIGLKHVITGHGLSLL
jgi:hypothetical protein